MEGLFIGKDNKYIDQVKGTSILSLLARTDNMEIMLYEFPAERPNSIVPGESQNLMEFYYILEGEISLEVEDNSYRLEKGEYFYVHNLKNTIPLRTISDTKMLYITSEPVYNGLYTYTNDLNDLLLKSEAKDVYTHKHSNRVQDYSVKIASKLGLSKEINYTISLASLFHDIGKCFIPDEILNKPSSLSDNEFDYIKKHSSYSAELLQGKFNNDIAIIVEQHHERLNGSGYPKGLRDNEIRIEAKIIAVADSYDAMTSDRAYRKGLTPKVAIEELITLIGILYDKQVVLAFEKVLQEEGTV